MALASNDETIDHLETLYETGSLTDESKFNDLNNRLTILGKKLNNFLSALDRDHNKIFTINEPEIEYLNTCTNHRHQESNNQYPK